MNRVRVGKGERLKEDDSGRSQCIDESELKTPKDRMNLRTFKKEVLFGLATVAVFGLLLYLETQLPFFTRFLPVGENKLIIVLLNINLLLILLLAFIIARILIKTNIEKKRGVYGSGLKTKLTLTMLSISLISSFTLFIIATGFFYVAMDKWFSQKIEDTIDTTVELSQLYYDDLFERYEKIGKHLAGQIEKKGILEKPDDSPDIHKQRRRGTLSRLSCRIRHDRSCSAEPGQDGRSGSAAAFGEIKSNCKREKTETDSSDGRWRSNRIGHWDGRPVR